MTKNTATESRFVQSRPKCLNPSGSDVKPPSSLEPAFIPVSLVGRSPVPGRLIFLKVIKSGQKLIRPSDRCEFRTERLERDFERFIQKVRNRWPF